MRNVRDVASVLLLLVLALAAPVAAQREQYVGAPPGAVGPDYDLAVGYSHVLMQMPGFSYANLNGVDLAANAAFTSHWGAVIDSNFVRTGNVLDTKHQAYQLGFYAGPVFYPVDLRNTRVFIHALFGADRVDGALPKPQDTNLHGWEEQFSYGFGGGFERALSGPLTVRVTGDYIRATFFDSSGALQPQNNFRMTASFVFHLYGLHRSRTR